MTLEIPGYRHLRSGKVRDLYAPEDESNTLLIVASDRISAFDFILPTEIPNKGKLLTALSQFWFNYLEEIVPNHIVSEVVPEIVKGRAVIVKPLEMFGIECVARGYLTGSGWKEYQESQSVCGIALPAGLQDGSKLPEPIFTPATKADIGDHDENIDFTRAASIVGEGNAVKLRELTLALYQRAHDYAATRGIILADTKFEFGLDSEGRITLVAEALTPDSSRFWSADEWVPGGAQASFDKQFVRDWLLASGWDRMSTPPELPANVVEKTVERYTSALIALSGRGL